MSSENILLIVPDPERIIPSFKDIEKFYPEINLIPATTGLEGLELYRKENPFLIIVSNHLQDISGCSVATIIKDNIQHSDDSYVWLVDLDKVILNTKADMFFPEPLNLKKFGHTLKDFCSSRTRSRIDYDQIKASKNSQLKQIPKRFKNRFFELNCIYSPFSFDGLSGDGAFYHYDESTSRLYGYLFDCTGHDLVAYYNTSSMNQTLWAFFGYNIKTEIDINLAEVFNQTNKTMFDVIATEEKITAAVIFIIDFKEETMKYCSAGIPYFLVKKQGSRAFEEIRMRNPLLGIDELSEYEEKEISIKNTEKIFISSDGFSKLLLSEERPIEMINNSKNDDTTLLMIDIKGEG